MKASSLKNLIIPGLIAPFVAVACWVAIVCITYIVHPFENDISLSFLILGVPIVALPIAYLYTFCVTVPLLYLTKKTGRLRRFVLYASALVFSLICALAMLVLGEPMGLIAFYFVWLYIPCCFAGAISFHFIHILLKCRSDKQQ
jgi:hypothetical protein